MPSTGSHRADRLGQHPAAAAADDAERQAEERGGEERGGGEHRRVDRALADQNVHWRSVHQRSAEVEPDGVADPGAVLLRE
jgi:hypothetical protein